jgi:hypothetical protein
MARKRSVKHINRAVWKEREQIDPMFSDYDINDISSPVDLFERELDKLNMRVKFESSNNE